MVDQHEGKLSDAWLPMPAGEHADLLLDGEEPEASIVGQAAHEASSVDGGEVEERAEHLATTIINAVREEIPPDIARETWKAIEDQASEMAEASEQERTT